MPRSRARCSRWYDRVEARPAVAARSQPVQDAGVGVHASADGRRDGRAVLRALHGALSRRGALAAASDDEVTALWSGLGYYARARNLRRAAAAIVAEHGGAIPASEAALRALPGIGPYTAAAVAAIAFDARAFALDGNTMRVLARLTGDARPVDVPATRAALHARGLAEVPRRRAGDFNQAMMELGALVCTPRNPRCDACPLAGGCRARAEGPGGVVAAQAAARRAARRARRLRLHHGRRARAGGQARRGAARGDLGAARGGGSGRARAPRGRAPAGRGDRRARRGRRVPRARSATCSPTATSPRSCSGSRSTRPDRRRADRRWVSPAALARSACRASRARPWNWALHEASDEDIGRSEM